MPSSDSKVPGFWREGDSIDQYDKATSRPVFHCTVPIALESLLTIAGTFFGATTASLGLVPIWIVVAAEDCVHHAIPTSYSIYAAVASVVVLVIHTLVTLEMLTREAMWKPGLPFLIVNVFMAYRLQVGWRGLYMYLWAWGAVQLLCHVIKLLVSRRRPCAVLRGELTKVPRRFRLADHLREGKAAIHSFPSGDVAGAGVFGAIMALITGQSAWLVIVAVTGFGRMYFHAHHLLDVVVGAGLGIGIVCLVDRLLSSWDGFGVYHFVSILVVSAVGWPLTNKIQPSLPEDLKPKRETYFHG